MTGSPSSRLWTSPHIASAICSARLGRGAAAHAVDQRELEALDLLLGRALAEGRERDAAEVLVPGALDHREPVAKGDRVGHPVRECRTLPSVSCPGSEHVLATSRRSCARTEPARVWSLVLAGVRDGGHRRDPVADRPGDRRRVPLATAATCRCTRRSVVAAALVRVVLSVARRLVAGRVSLGVELDLRNLLYGHLQALELGFFARQQTGQLMSRATVDLQAVRFFLGYGLVFISQSALTILLAASRCSCCSRASRCSRCARAVRRRRSPAATGAARGRRCRRSSSGSPS